MCITINDGQQINFASDNQNRISQMDVPGIGIFRYEYDGITGLAGANNLTAVRKPDGTLRIYHYEDKRFPNALTGITDERGIRYATYEYDDQGRATASYHGPQTSALGDRINGISITFNSDGMRVVKNSRDSAKGRSGSTYTTTTQLGVALVTGISGPGCSSCGASNASYQYDAANNLISKANNNHVTRYGNYDANGNPGCVVEGVSTADTSTGVCTFDAAASPNARRIDYTYDPRFHSKVATISEPSVRSGSTKLTINTYDAYGNLTGVTITGFTPTGAPVSRTSTYTYAGPLHQLSQIDGPRTDLQDLTAFSYYPDDPTQGNNRARLQRITDQNGLLLRDALQYSATGKVLSESHPNAVSLTYTHYTGNDRLQTVTETAAAVSRTTRWTYLPTGEVAGLTRGDGSPAATTLSFGYDAGRRLTRITDGLGNSIQYTLDTEGNRIGEQTYDSNGALKKAITQTFDDYNHLHTRSQANETLTTAVNPDGTLGSVVDGRSSTTQYSYDALKRLISTTQDLGGTNPATQDALTQYQYNSQDALTRVTDPDGNATSYAYDDLGNLISQTSPDTGTTQYGADGAGNLASRTDAKGQVFHYSYDAANRLTLIDAPGSNDDITVSYDSCANGLGHLCQLSTPGNSVFYRYTAFGEIATSAGMAYHYDAAGRVQTLTYPSGAVLSYGYDAAGQVNSVQLNRNGTLTTLAGAIAHAPFGPVTALSYGNGKTLTQTLDSAYRLQTQQVQSALNLGYPQYDGNGNLTQRSDSFATPATGNFGYDALDRLDTASGAFGSRSYGYDKNGNRTQLNNGAITAYDYEPLGTGTQNNRLIKLGSSDVLSDPNGNTLSNGVWSYSYTAHNRLKDAKQNGTIVGSYSYNGLGQRIQKTLPNGKGRVFLYGQNGELLAEADQGGTVLTEYLYLDGTLLAINQPDDNGNGLTNAQEDAAGTNPTTADYDGDGLSNTTEWFVTGTNANQADTDGDGVSDGQEVSKGTDPLNSSQYPGDGDLNQDGTVDAGDLVLEMQIVLGTRTPTSVQLVHGDMNQDGVINTPDLLKLERKALGLALNDLLGRLPGYRTLLASLDRAEATLHNNTRQLLAALISPAEAATPGGKIYYVHTDQLGTPQVLTDETGAVAWRGSYDPFGLATVAPGAVVEMNVRFAGQYFDSETGLHYNYFRDYDPRTGRYVESDPIGLLGGTNTYAYVDDNPINYIDPIGLFHFCTRPLNGSPITLSLYPESFNLGVLHEQGFYDDNTGDNVGYFPNGVHKDSAGNAGKYSCSSEHYDDNTMRQAQEKVDKSFPASKYNLLLNNCQDYASQLLQEYNSILVNKPH